jgi:hypothetical protein
VTEFDGWKITRKKWKYGELRITGIVYKTRSQKVILEFKMHDCVKNQTISKIFRYNSVEEAVKEMQGMQGYRG